MDDEFDDELEHLRKKRLEEIKAKMKYPKEPIKVDDKTLDEVVQRYPLMVIDCWAAWCMPCRIIEPVIEELAREYAGRVVFGKLNVDENRISAQRFGIMSIPTLLFFKNGKLVDLLVGAVPKEHIISKIQRIR
ncbi:MAG: thioredoxin [Candidatus Altiarchaeales archaeon]|nr:MAG: thioredoxin [Candidatus Altiarchaeales archaeon]